MKKKYSFATKLQVTSIDTSVLILLQSSIVLRVYTEREDNMIRMLEDVIEDLKRIAPLLVFSGYQPLARAYIGQGLRVDLERFENDVVVALVESLKR